MRFSYTVQKLLNLLPHFVTNCLEETQIWKAISVNTETQSAVDFTDDLNIARYIFDSQSANQQGGTGKTF